MGQNGHVLEKAYPIGETVDLPRPDTPGEIEEEAIKKGAFRKIFLKGATLVTVVGSVASFFYLDSLKKNEPIDPNYGAKPAATDTLERTAVPNEDGTAHALPIPDQDLAGEDLFKGPYPLSELADVREDGTIVPNGVDIDENGNFKYDFSDPEQAIAAMFEGVNNRDFNLLDELSGGNGAYDLFLDEKGDFVGEISKYIPTRKSKGQGFETSYFEITFINDKGNTYNGEIAIRWKRNDEGNINIKSTFIL